MVKVRIVLFFTSFLSRLCTVEMGLQDTLLSTPDFVKLLELKKMLEKDSEQLFRDIQLSNPYAGRYRDAFMDKIGELKQRLDKNQ
jgi:hypothetical protein